MPLGRGQIKDATGLFTATLNSKKALRYCTINERSVNAYVLCRNVTSLHVSLLLSVFNVFICELTRWETKIGIIQDYLEDMWITSSCLIVFMLCIIVCKGEGMEAVSLLIQINVVILLFVSCFKYCIASFSQLHHSLRFSV